MRERSRFRLREQFTVSDCFPTSVLNALGTMFKRSDIPPEVLQRVYLYSLDGVDKGAPRCRWTSGEAARFLADWLEGFRTKRFRVSIDYFEGQDVQLGHRNPISRCLAAGGAAVVDILSTGGYAHSVTLLGIERDWVQIWDPLPRGIPRVLRGDAIQTLESDGHSANFRVRRDHFAMARAQPFSLGPLAERACMLFRRG